jgi:hypothetical protein
MRKVVFILAVVAAAVAPALASAGGKHHRARPAPVAAQADPNANTGHLFHDLIWGKK